MELKSSEIIGCFGSNKPWPRPLIQQRMRFAPPLPSRAWLLRSTEPLRILSVLSPHSRVSEMVGKFQFYDRFAVEEYYLFDPDRIELNGWIRRGDDLVQIGQVDGSTSPRLGVRFDLSSGDLQVFGPDGRPFATYVELVAQREQERQRAQQEHLRAERLAAQLRALGVEPNG